MISRLLYALEAGLEYVKNHPHILFVFVLLVAVPLLFLYSGQQFLEVGRGNQDRLQKDRVGLMQDVFASLLVASDYNAEVIQREIESVSVINPDITAFRVVKQTPEGYVPIAALDRELLGKAEETNDFYVRSAVSVGESLIFAFFEPEGRIWLAFRSVPTDEAHYFIFTQFSLAAVDDLFAQKEREVLWFLGFVYLFFLAIAYWMIKITDYRYLYIKMNEANKMKDLFTNMIAHELRTPLTAIRGYAELAQDDATTDEERKYAIRIHQASERLIAIVNDLLDVARLQSGKLAVVEESVDVVATIRAVLDELRVSADEKSITLAQTGEGSEVLVAADQKRLHQALTNLVSNAIKYTKEGTIELSVEAAYHEVEVRVKDTGMGISAADQQKLFAPFFRVQSDDVSAITGTGLGMWITRQLIELMGAKIGVESIKGVGTHIVMTFEKAAPAE